MPFRLADVQYSGTSSFLSSRDVAQDIMRDVLAHGQLSTPTMGLFSPDLLRTLLAQRSAEYKVGLHDSIIYSDLDGWDLLADVSLRGRRRVMRFY